MTPLLHQARLHSSYVFTRGEDLNKGLSAVDGSHSELIRCLTVGLLGAPRFWWCRRITHSWAPFERSERPERPQCAFRSTHQKKKSRPLF